MKIDEEAGDLSPEEARNLRFLHGEGLELLEKYRRIGSSERRKLIMDLVGMFAEEPPPKRLDGKY